MSAHPKFTPAFNIQTINEQRCEMSALCERTFRARELSKKTPPGGSDIYIMMELCGTEILLEPGSVPTSGMQNPMICEVRFSEEQIFIRHRIS